MRTGGDEVADPREPRAGTGERGRLGVVPAAQRVDARGRRRHLAGLDDGQHVGGQQPAAADPEGDVPGGEVGDGGR